MLELSYLTKKQDIGKPLLIVSLLFMISKNGFSL